MVDWNDDTPIENLDDITNAEAAEVFASEYDPTIKSLLGVLTQFGYTDEQFDADLRMCNDMLETIGLLVPEGITVGASMPYVLVSDVMVAGILGHRLWQMREFITEAVLAEESPTFQEGQDGA